MQQTVVVSSVKRKPEEASEELRDRGDTNATQEDGEEEDRAPAAQQKAKRREEAPVGPCFR